MYLVDNWRSVLLRASSIWVTYGAVVLAGIYANLPYFQELVGKSVFAWLMMGFGVSSVVARVVAQPESLPKL